MPAAARKSTKAGAKAFVLYWIDVLNYAGATGDVGGLRSISAQRCAGCAGVIGTMRRAYADGGRIVGGAWQLPLLGQYEPTRGDYAFAGRVKVGAQQLLNGQGDVTRKYAGGQLVAVFQVARSSRGWRMAWVDTRVL